MGAVNVALVGKGNDIEEETRLIKIDTGKTETSTIGMDTSNLFGYFFLS